MSLTEVKMKVVEKIKSEWQMRGKLHLLPTIPQNTLNRYASLIKSLSIFNVHPSILNKTESHITAEWSKCSTIAYTMTMAVSHFIPDIEPTPFHPKREDISKYGLEMLKLVEENYNKLIGNPDKPVNVVPVLPNLVTSTDEVTLFATASKINGKNDFYIVAKPTSMKNEKIDSSSRNHYKKQQTGDSHCRGC